MHPDALDPNTVPPLGLMECIGGDPYYCTGRYFWTLVLYTERVPEGACEEAHRELVGHHVDQMTAGLRALHGG